jgi:hypothetical protein
VLSRLSPVTQQVLAVALPLVSLVIAIFLIVPRYQALRRDEAALTQTRQEVTAKRALIEAAERRGPIPPVRASVPATGGEAVQFQRELDLLARASGVKLNTVALTTAAAAPAADAAATAGANPSGANVALPTGTTAATIQLSVSGPFAAMARFFQSLENYRRLVRVSNVTMSGGGADNSLNAQFQLTRFVESADAATGATPLPAGG